MTSLLTRLESGAGSDRELDCRLHVLEMRRPGDDREMHTIGPPTYDPPRHFFNPSPEIDWNGYDLLNNAPPFTSSLDAALSLVERMLPGWDWYVRLATSAAPPPFSPRLHRRRNHDP